MVRAIVIIMILSLFTKSYANYENLAYDFKFKGIDGKVINLADYENKIIVVVNVASRCGYTPQYDGLQKLWSKYNKNKIVVIGVPSNNFKQEPGSNLEIKSFCETNFNIDFPMTEKMSVIGQEAHPFFKWAKDNHGISAVPKWNFHKIIVGRDGKILDTFSAFTKPLSKKVISVIDKELKS
tara:strand:- start:300 stop:842 length:543 start_codon:yes stop_codon:yes gene_type:complete